MRTPKKSDAKNGTTINNDMKKCRKNICSYIHIFHSRMTRGLSINPKQRSVVLCTPQITQCAVGDETNSSRKKVYIYNREAHTQIPQILHEIIVGSSEMITARWGPYLLACLYHLIFASCDALSLSPAPFSPSICLTSSLIFCQQQNRMQFAAATVATEHYIAYVFSQITHLLTSETLNHYNIAQFNG